MDIADFSLDLFSLAGRTQPDRPQWNPLGYANHAIQEVRLNSGPGTRR